MARLTRDTYFSLRNKNFYVSLFTANSLLAELFVIKYSAVQGMTSKLAAMLPELNI